jgi:hypothetical protein
MTAVSFRIDVIEVLILSTFFTARGAPPPRALARRLRASLGLQALLIPRLSCFLLDSSTNDFQALYLLPFTFYLFISQHARAASP